MFKQPVSYIEAYSLPSLAPRTTIKMFRYSTAALAIVSLASAAPATQKRDSGLNDAVILNYALTLEHLEDSFYREGLSNFTEQDFADAGFDSVFYNNIKTVSSDETQHVKFLTSALQGLCPSACSHRSNRGEDK
jgi:hypothetical protein